MKIKIKFWSFTESGGDGSAYPRFFATEEEAEAYCKKQDEEFGENFTECVSSHELVVDEKGNILKGMFVPFNER
jgi:hypothetical protein